MCTVEAYRLICVFGAKRGKRRGEASPFPPFLSLIHILPICFDSAQVLHISRKVIPGTYRLVFISILQIGDLKTTYA